MFLDESESFDAVFALGDEMDLGETFEEKREFVARGFFVVYDECVDWHDGAWTWAWSVYATGVLRSTWARAPSKAEKLLTVKRKSPRPSPPHFMFSLSSKNHPPNLRPYQPLLRKRLKQD